MKTRHHAATLLFALAPALAAPAAGRAQQPADSVTLEQAIELALRHQPAVVQADATLTSAHAAERTAWGAFLPNISISSGASLESSERFNPQTNTLVTGSSDSYNMGLSASLDLFSGGRRLATLRQSRAETDAAEAGLIEQRFATILATKRAFYDVLRADELIRAAQARLRRAEEALEAAERRAEVGSGTRSDILRARLELAQARRAVLEAETGKTTAAYNLGRLIGRAGPVAARGTGPAEPAPLALTDAELERLVVERAPSVVAATAALRAAEASADVARAQYLPSLRLTSGYNWFNPDPRLDGGRTSWSLRLGLSYPLFNGFQREENAARASANARAARARLEDARRAAVSELHRLLAALRLAEQQIALSREAVEVAAEDLRVQQERYRLGASTILDLMASQAALADAELNLVAARYDYQLARSELEALAGREL